MTGEDKGFKMLQQQYATKFSIPVREDIWEKRGMFPEINLEEYEKSNGFRNRADTDDVHSVTSTDATD
jgi:hypothetical protein